MRSNKTRCCIRNISQESGAPGCMSPWWPLLGLLLWYPIFELGHWNPFEDWAPVDFIYGSDLQITFRLDCRTTLKTKSRKIDNFVITGGIVRCLNNNFRCHYWRQCYQFDDLLFSVRVRGYSPRNGHKTTCPLHKIQHMAHCEGEL